jgi:hypothetical protein
VVLLGKECAALPEDGQGASSSCHEPRTSRRASSAMHVVVTACCSGAKFLHGIGLLTKI